MSNMLQAMLRCHTPGCRSEDDVPVLLHGMEVPGDLQPRPPANPARLPARLCRSRNARRVFWYLFSCALTVWLVRWVGSLEGLSLAWVLLSATLVRGAEGQLDIHGCSLCTCGCAC